MPTLNVVALLIVILGNKIRSPNAIKLLRLNLWIGLAYWASIVICVSVLTIPLGDYPVSPLRVEFLTKLFTTVIFYRTLHWTSEKTERRWIYAMFGLNALDFVLVMIHILSK